MDGHDAVASALPYYLNVDAAAAAIEAGIHFADLGGNTAIVRRQQALDAEARRRGVSVVPDCGVAPGLVNILAAEAVRRLDEPRSVKLLVGGLPQHPRPPLNYSIVYSLEGVLDYYTTPSAVLRDGAVVEVAALSELETVEFPAPLGLLEAFHTAGGASTMPWEYAGTLRHLEYKTLRYPGHAAIMTAIRELGLLDLTPLTVKGQRVVPRDVFIAAVDPRLRRAEPDLLALRATADGAAAGRAARVVFEVVDLFDAQHGISAMMRTTAYSLSITSQLQAAGKIPPGVKTAWEATPFGAYVAQLAARGIEVRETGKGNGDA
jgi:lysine 6-dehydrogenase